MGFQALLRSILLYIFFYGHQDADEGFSGADIRSWGVGETLEVADDCRGVGVDTPHPHSDCPSSRLTFKTHTVLTRSIPQISIMIHQLLFAKNITQIAHGMKLLESNLRRNVSPFPGNVIAG